MRGGSLIRSEQPRAVCDHWPNVSRSVGRSLSGLANLKNIREESRRLRKIYNQAWEKNWGFVPFTEAEIEFMTHELKQLVIPEFTLIAEIGDEPVGFILCVPDINVALRYINGRLTTFGLPIGLDETSLPQEPHAECAAHRTWRD